MLSAALLLKMEHGYPELKYDFILEVISVVFLFKFSHKIWGFKHYILVEFFIY